MVVCPQLQAQFYTLWEENEKMARHKAQLELQLARLKNMNALDETLEIQVSVARYQLSLRRLCLCILMSPPAACEAVCFWVICPSVTQCFQKKIQQFILSQSADKNISLDGEPAQFFEGSELFGGILVEFTLVLSLLLKNSKSPSPGRQNPDLATKIGP